MSSLARSWKWWSDCQAIITLEESSGHGCRNHILTLVSTEDQALGYKKGSGEVCELSHVCCRVIHMSRT